MIRLRFATTFVLTLLTAVTGIALGGPPLICQPIDIGDAETLPAEIRDADKKLGADRIVNDTTRLLRSETSTLVRMETLRRAAIHLGQRDSNVKDLLSRLMARALDAEAAGESCAAAWLDAGYFVQTCDQLGSLGRSYASYGARDGVAGYAWVLRALEKSGGDPSMELAAAMMTAMARTDAFDDHLDRAIEGAAADAHLSHNIDDIAKRLREIRGYFDGRRKK